MFASAAQHYARNLREQIETLVVIPFWDEIERFNGHARREVCRVGLLGEAEVVREAVKPLSGTGRFSTADTTWPRCSTPSDEPSLHVCEPTPNSLMMSHTKTMSSRQASGLSPSPLRLRNNDKWPSAPGCILVGVMSARRAGQQKTGRSPGGQRRPADRKL